MTKTFKRVFLITCLLYTSDAADDLLCVDLGGRRIIKKKNNTNNNNTQQPLYHHQYHPTNQPSH